MSLVPTPALQDCWNQVGVQGNASCPRLTEFSHCRNCPVYASAAAGLLHGEPPAEYLAEWTERLAQPRERMDAEQRSQPVMIFRLGAEWLALPAAIFQEVAAPRPIHSFPHRRGKLVRGLVNIRGELVVCVSLGDALGIDERANGARRNGSQRHTVYERLLVVSTPGGRLAFPVTEVFGIESFTPAQWRPVPETLALASARYTGAIVSWQGRTLGGLDDARLFSTLNRSLD